MRRSVLELVVEFNRECNQDLGKQSGQWRAWMLVWKYGLHRSWTIETILILPGLPKRRNHFSVLLK